MTAAKDCSFDVMETDPSTGKALTATVTLNIDAGTSCCRFNQDILKDPTSVPSHLPTDCPAGQQELKETMVVNGGKCSGNKCDVTGNPAFSLYGYSSDCCKAIQKAAETGEEPSDPPAECASVDSFCMTMTTLRP